MRIIAGEYRGRHLKSPPDLKTRPTSDRLRETLFNILNQRIDEETVFLDLCAGTGAVGIEALSRGAGYAVFVDKSRKSCGLIETNLDMLKISEDKTEVVMSDASDFLKKTTNSFDIVFYDPPYEVNYYGVIEQFGTADITLLNEGGLFIAEHLTKNPLPDLVGELRRWRIVKQGDSSLSFYERS